MDYILVEFENILHNIHGLICYRLVLPYHSVQHATDPNDPPQMGAKSTIDKADFQKTVHPDAFLVEAIAKRF